jgi:phage FluMu protein Com
MSEYKIIRCPACEEALLAFVERYPFRIGPDWVKLRCPNCDAELHAMEHLLEKEE